MSNIIDQQKKAIQNVAYNGDSTWNTNLSFAYQKSNMNLYLINRYIELKSNKWTQYTPRTVRDNIPFSKLAQYANYEYNEARELSYSPLILADNKIERLHEKFDKNQITEPWMLEDVDNILISFLINANNNENRFNNFYNSTKITAKDVFYESPFLEANNFDEMVLRLKILSGNVKKIWNIENSHLFEPETKLKNFFLFKSPIMQIFTTTNNFSSKRNNNDNNNNNVKDKITIKPLKKETIMKNFNKEQKIINNPWFCNNNKKTLKSSENPNKNNKRLYSAVLQGESSSSNNNHNHLPEIIKPQLFSPYLTTKTTTNAATTINNTVIFPNIQTFPPPTQTATINNNARLYPNPIINFQQTTYFPLLLQNPNTTTTTATNSYRILNYPQYQRNYPMVQIPPHHHPSRPQLFVPSTVGGWFLQSPVKIGPQLNILNRPIYHHQHYQQFRPQSSHAVNNNNSVRFKLLNQNNNKLIITDNNQQAEIVKTVLNNDDFVPIQEISSEDLEIQALEQYNNTDDESNTNVFQKLEKEAVEQYQNLEHDEQTSENWMNPLKFNLLTVFFGGCFIYILNWF